jgi:gamma-glutamyltranspeptidase/glutathione hydrolase
MFAAADAHHPPSSESMVGVPGTVRGLALAHRRYGRLPWKQLVEPAVVLARDGFEVDADLAAALNAALARAGNFAEFRRTFAPPRPGAPWRAGDRLVQPDLAHTLDRIAGQGAAAFYGGPVARAIADTVRRGEGGVLTEQDLADYRAEVRPPVHGRFRAFDVYGPPPPPSSGGVAVVEMLNILETFDLRRDGRWSSRTLHRMVEAMRRAFVDRATFLGDSDYGTVPVAGLTSKLYADNLAAGIDDDHSSSSEKLAAAAGITIDASAAESSHTTHFSVIDADGTAVSNTYTLEQAFGGMLVVKGCGFLLNNEMGDFNPRPGHTDRTGRIGTPPNVLRPGKRMLSSMAPTVVARDGKVVLVTGSPGGRTIINTVLCVLLNVLEFDMPLREAVDAPRLHHQWLPDTITVEPALRTDHPEAVEALRRLGHVIAEQSPRQGDAHSIAVRADGTYVGVADTRRSGAAAGY